MKIQSRIFHGPTILAIAGVLLANLMSGCAIQSEASPTTAAVAEPAAAPHPVAALPAATQAAEPAWAAISKVLDRPGVLKESVYVITVPRDDLDVTIDHMGVPTAAGIESVFYFYRCPCGKMIVVGQFVACDYEANDVVDALRQNATLKVPAIAPIFLYENPRLQLVRFQGEGDAVAMAGVIREALRWTGRERMAPDPLPKPEK